MHRLVTRLGLVKAIDAALNLLKIHLPYHESDHVLTLAYSVLRGGTRLEDVDRLRNDAPLMNGLGARLLPDPTTTGDFLRRFTEADIVALMDAVNSVHRLVLPSPHSPGQSIGSIAHHEHAAVHNGREENSDLGGFRSSEP